MSKKHKPHSRHHRKCVFNGGLDNKENISIVHPNKHRAWHLLFGHKTPQEIADEINQVWLDPEWQMVAVLRGRAIPEFGALEKLPFTPP